VNATTSDFSFVTRNGEIPISAFPLITKATIPFHDPLSVSEPYLSSSLMTELI
jgi:hypothetical protein